MTMDKAISPLRLALAAPPLDVAVQATARRRMEATEYPAGWAAAAERARLCAG
jgi:hypothetical protein